MPTTGETADGASTEISEGSDPSTVLGPRAGAYPRRPPSRIAYTSNLDGNPEIYVHTDNPAVESEYTTRLTNSAATDHQPDMSPVDYLVAFTSDRDGNDEIYSASDSPGARTYG